MSIRCSRPEYTSGRIIPGVKAAYARLYPGILWTRPIYTPGYIMALANSHPLRPIPIISITILIVLSDVLKNYLIFQQVTEDLVLSGKLRETAAKLTELKS